MFYKKREKNRTITEKILTKNEENDNLRLNLYIQVKHVYTLLNKKQKMRLITNLEDYYDYYWRKN